MQQQVSKEEGSRPPHEPVSISLSVTCAACEGKVGVLLLVEPLISALFPEPALLPPAHHRCPRPNSHLSTLLAERGIANMSSENKTDLDESCLRDSEEEQVDFRQDPSHLSHGPHE